MEQVRLRDCYEEAASLVRLGDLDRAIRVTRHILRHYPRYSAGHQLLGQALLQSGRHRESVTQFLRVLSADPENVTARLGLSRVYAEIGQWHKSIDQLQLAADLSPGDSGLRRQLVQLVTAHRGNATAELEISRAGLGRIYARNGLYPKSIQEFNAVLAYEPTRFDVRLALAEVLWRDGRHLEAVEVCHQVLDRLPGALKANLIMAAVWLDSPQPDEAEPYLRLAQALDPENGNAKILFGGRSPLPPRTAEIDRMHEATEQPDLPPPTLKPAHVPYPQGLAPPDGDWPNASNKEETAAMSDEYLEDEEFEIPDWLKGVGDDLLADEGEQTVPTTTTATPSAPEEAPEWLHDLVTHAEEAGSSEAYPATALPSADESAHMLDQLETPLVDTPSAASAKPPQELDLPDWLSDSVSGEETYEPAPSAVPTPTEPGLELPDSGADMTDWIAKVTEAEAETTATSEESQPPQGQAEPIATPAEAVAPEIEEGTLPDWLSQMPEPESIATSTQSGEAGLLPAELASLDIEVTETDLPERFPDFQGQEAVSDEPMATFPPPAEPTAGLEDLPDWLQPEADEMTAAEAEKTLPDETEIPVWLTEDAEPASLVIPESETVELVGEVTEDAEAQEKESLPDWLRELQQPSPSREDLATEAIEPLAPAGASETELDTPDWMRRLRDAGTEEISDEPASDLEDDLAPAAAAASAATQLLEEEVILPDPTPAETPLDEAPASPPVEETHPETDEVVELMTTAQAATPAKIEEAAPPAPDELTDPTATSQVEPLQVGAFPEEPEERLALARAALKSGSWPQALSIYTTLVNSAELLDGVIDDLEEGIRNHPEDFAGYQMIGDAYMKDGRLPSALQAYRTALAKLH